MCFSASFSLRSECSNCEVGEQCGVLMHGRMVTFCEPFGQRDLVKTHCYAQAHTHTYTHKHTTHTHCFLYTSTQTSTPTTRHTHTRVHTHTHAHTCTHHANLFLSVPVS